MGNCIRKESSMQWGGEDWGSFRSSGDKKYSESRENQKHDNYYSTTDTHLQEKTGLLGERRGGVLSSAFTSTGTDHQVKVKISKKELEHLLKKADFLGVPMDDVLSELMNGGDLLRDHHQRPWIPALQSIPE